MKKFVSGIIVGALLFSGVSAFADSTSLIGQKVQGMFSVEKGGKKIADAVIIKGSAYAPVKAVADAAGVGLTVEGKKIIMNTDATETSLTGDLQNLIMKRTGIQKQISDIQGGIKMYETTYIPNAERNYNGALTEVEKTGSAAALEARKAELEQRKSELATLQQQLADLDAQIQALKP